MSYLNGSKWIYFKIYLVGVSTKSGKYVLRFSSLWRKSWHLHLKLFNSILLNIFGTVDILLNNAGIGSKGINYDKTDYQAFENVMKINAWGPFVGMKTVAPIMIKNKKGSIINVSSLAAVKSIEFNAYSLSKGAVISLTKAASADLGKNGIRVNTIIPGTIETPMTKIICDYPNVLNSCIEKTALGHIGEADDIAYCALYLASDESKYTTGTDITIDGGQRYKDTLELEM